MAIGSQACGVNLSLGDVDRVISKKLVLEIKLISIVLLMAT